MLHTDFFPEGQDCDGGIYMNMLVQAFRKLRYAHREILQEILPLLSHHCSRLIRMKKELLLGKLLI